MHFTGKQVTVTATTGMAATLLPQPATTIHRFSGYLDGRFQIEELCKRLCLDEELSHVRENICNTNSLIVDVISMMSLRMFEQLDTIQTCKQNPFCLLGVCRWYLVGTSSSYHLEATQNIMTMGHIALKVSIGKELCPIMKNYYMCTDSQSQC
jgi:hypothetical protein